MLKFGKIQKKGKITTLPNTTKPLQKWLCFLFSCLLRCQSNMQHKIV